MKVKESVDMDDGTRIGEAHITQSTSMSRIRIVDMRCVDGSL